MSNAMVKHDEKFSQDQVNLIKSQIAKGATDDELAMFTTIAQRYGLDPFLKEIWFIKQAKKQQVSPGKWEYKRNKDGSIDYTGADTLIYTSRDGYLKIAQRDDNFKGILSMAVCEGDNFEVDAENYKVTHKFGAKRGAIIGAWAKVDHKHRNPVIVYIPLKEYYSDKSTTWKQYPTAMIIKVAEVLALKRQFGISGLVTREEMSHVIDEPIPEPVIEAEVITTEIVEDKPEEPKPNADQIKRLYTLATKANKTQDDVHVWIDKNFGKKSTKDLTIKEYDKVTEALEVAKVSYEKSKQEEKKDE